MVNNEFWIERWAENRIGFHRPAVQPLLERFWTEVATGAGRVLVPLCGKSHDMIWLAARGHRVLGVDISRIAAQSFAAEHGLDFEVIEEPPFTLMREEKVDFLIGDFFGLKPERVGRFALVYDRAALIALPEERRRDYVSTVESLIETAAHILLITIEYEPGAMEGPPYSVGEEEVRALYADAAVAKLYEHDCLDQEPRFRERGLEWMREAVYRIQM